MLGSAHLTSPDDKQKTFTTSYPGMAHFAGTGPHGKTCRECCHFAPMWDGGASYYAKKGIYGGGLKDHRCSRYREMMHGAAGAKIPHAAPACKYFEQAKNPPHGFKK